MTAQPDAEWRAWLSAQAQALGVDLPPSAQNADWVDAVLAAPATCPTDVPTIVAASLRHCFLQNPDGAAAFIIEQLQRGISDSFLSDYLSILRIMQGQPLQALEDYKKILEAMPDLLPVWVSLSAIAHELNDIDQSVAALHRVVALIAPGGPCADHAHLRGLIWFNLGFRRAARLYTRAQAEEAADAYRHALAVGFEEDAVHFNLGLLLVEMGEIDEARALLSKLPPDRRLLHWPLWSPWPALANA